jgi:hypothetical protein
MFPRERASLEHAPVRPRECEWLPTTERLARWQHHYWPPEEPLGTDYRTVISGKARTCGKCGIAFPILPIWQRRASPKFSLGGARVSVSIVGGKLFRFERRRNSQAASVTHKRDAYGRSAQSSAHVAMYPHALSATQLNGPMPRQWTVECVSDADCAHRAIALRCAAGRRIPSRFVCKSRLVVADIRFCALPCPGAKQKWACSRCARAWHP